MRTKKSGILFSNRMLLKKFSSFAGIVFPACLAVFLVLSCNAPVNQEHSGLGKILELDERYAAIESMVSKANCFGRGNSFQTEVHSTKVDSLYFKQVYSDRDDITEIFLNNRNNGFSIDREKGKKDTLQAAVLSMIRGHEFHKISIRPEEYFYRLAAHNSATESDSIRKFSGIDELNLPVTISVDTRKKRIIDYEIHNPFDSSETIRMRYSNWENTDYGFLARSLEIIQGEKDTFNYDFTELMINEKLIWKDQE